MSTCKREATTAILPSFHIGDRVRITAEWAGFLPVRIVGLTGVVLRASASGFAVRMDSAFERETWLTRFVPRHAAETCLERING